ALPPSRREGQGREPTYSPKGARHTGFKQRPARSIAPHPSPPPRRPPSLLAGGPGEGAHIQPQRGPPLRIQTRPEGPVRIRSGGPLRMVRRRTWSGRERSSHSRAEPVPESGSPPSPLSRAEPAGHRPPARP